MKPSNPLKRYDCRYLFENHTMWVDIDQLSEVKGGFWINKDHDITTGEDRKWWIPESRIVYVVKKKD